MSVSTRAPSNWISHKTPDISHFDRAPIKATLTFSAVLSPRLASPSLPERRTNASLASNVLARFAYMRIDRKLAVVSGQGREQVERRESRRATRGGGRGEMRSILFRPTAGTRFAVEYPYGWCWIGGSKPTRSVYRCSLTCTLSLFPLPLSLSLSLSRLFSRARSFSSQYSRDVHTFVPACHAYLLTLRRIRDAHMLPRRYDPLAT